MRLGSDRYSYEANGPAVLAFTPDGKTLLGAPASGGTLYEWESVSGKLIRKDQLIKNVVRGSQLELSSDGKWIASSIGTHISIWSVPPSAPQPRFTVDSMVLSRKVTFTPDGKHFITLGGDHVKKEVYFWDLQTGALQKKVQLQPNRSAKGREAERAIAQRQRRFFQEVGPTQLSGLEISPDGKVLIAITGKRGPARFWDQSGKPLENFPLDATDYAFSPDGKKLAFAGLEGVFFWDCVEGKRQTKLPVDHTGGFVLAFSPDGKYLAASSVNQVVVLEVSNSQVVRRFPAPVLFANVLRFSPDDKLLAVASSDGAIQVWNLETGKENQPAGHHSSIATIVFSHDGTKIATGEQRGDIRVWEASSGRTVQSLRAPGPAHELLFSRDDQSLLSRGYGIAVWNVASGNVLNSFSLPDGARTGWGLQSMALHPDGVTLSAVAERDGASVRDITWDIFSGKTTGSRNASYGDGARWLLSPDGRLRASYQSRFSKIYETSSGKLLATLDGKFESFYAVAFSANSQKLVGLCTQGAGEPLAAVWWDVPSGKELGRLLTAVRVPATRDRVAPVALAFSPDAKLLATEAQENGGIQLWDTSSQKEIGRFIGSSDKITALTFDPSGRRLASGQANGVVLLWDVEKAGAPQIPGGAPSPKNRSSEPLRKPPGEP
jgi:WD40 repeat protein